MTYIIISLILILASVAVIVLKIKKNKVKEIKPNKIKLDTDVIGFDEVKRFDRDRYIEETFNQVFNAIQHDEWLLSFGYDNIEFKKDNILLKVEYSEYGNFKIKSITLTSGYSNYYYKSDLDESVYRFFYKVYSDCINQENEQIKKKTDKSLSEINKVLGKGAIRDSKIDQLLKGI